MSGLRGTGFGAGATALLAALSLPLCGQRGETRTDAGAGHAPPIAGTKQGDVPPAVHAPQPELQPALALHHVRAGNAAFAKARAEGAPVPAPPTRPAGAGRYVALVLVCADCQVDAAATLGLRPRDVLVLSAPGPFVSAEDTALVEQLVVEERLSLVVVLAHAEHRCRALSTKPGVTPRQDALAARVQALRERARAARQPLAKTLALAQREALLAASDVLRQRVDADAVRIVPAELDADTGAIAWHGSRADEMPLRPVK